MTATLKNTPQGYVLIVNERPEYGKDLHYYDSSINEIHPNDTDDEPDNYCFRIIASETPLEGVKGIRFRVNKNIIFHNDGNYERLVKKLIDTEVQATEHEEYWVLGL